MNNRVRITVKHRAEVDYERLAAVLLQIIERERAEAAAKSVTPRTKRPAPKRPRRSA